MFKKAVCKKQTARAITEKRNTQQKSLRKTGNVCYFVVVFACGFETRASPSDSLATAGSFHLMKFRKRSQCFVYVLPGAGYLTYKCFKFRLPHRRRVRDGDDGPSRSRSRCR